MSSLSGMDAMYELLLTHDAESGLVMMPVMTLTCRTCLVAAAVAASAAAAACRSTPRFCPSYSPRVASAGVVASAAAAAASPEAAVLVVSPAVSPDNLVVSTSVDTGTRTTMRSAAHRPTLKAMSKRKGKDAAMVGTMKMMKTAARTARNRRRGGRPRSRRLPPHETDSYISSDILA